MLKHPRNGPRGKASQRGNLRDSVSLFVHHPRGSSKPKGCSKKALESSWGRSLSCKPFGKRVTCGALKGPSITKRHGEAARRRIPSRPPLSSRNREL